MNSPQSCSLFSNVEEDISLAMHLSMVGLVPYAINTVKELGLLEIMAKAKPMGTHLSPLDLASIVAPENQEAPMMIDRLLRLLVAYSVFTYKFVKDKEGRESRVYGLGRVGKTLIKNEDGYSMLPHVFDGNRRHMWSYLTEWILEGGATPWERTFGPIVFEDVKKNEESLKGFNESLTNHTSIEMKKIIENYYNGFESLSGCTLVDVGGCLGTSLAQILSKFPLIKGVNFDLPHTIKEAPQIQGVEHIAGDMFVEIPQGDTIMMKSVLHDWSDEKCVEILRNCKKALPETGKIILIERIVPREIADDVATKISLCSDVKMMALTRGGRERTKEEFEDLAMKAGFNIPKIVYGAYAYWILELYPN